MKKIILASGSPRRTEILKTLGIAHTIKVADIDETPNEEERPIDLVKRLATGKALKVSSSEKEAYVIGSDTIVVLDDEILGKPIDEADAFRMLSSISNRWHEVVTGICIVDASSGDYKVDVGVTKVKMNLLSEEHMKAYIQTGEPMDKAGAYAIQEIGSTLVEQVEGEFSTVVGLSVQTLIRLFEGFGLDYYKDLRA